MRLRHIISTGLLMVLATSLVFAQDLRPREGNLRAGDVAPDFVVKDLQGQTTVKLSELKDKPVVLVFGSCT